MSPLLAIQGLTVTLRSGKSTLRALDDIGLTLSDGETLALVGESGCGKSMTALAIMGLLPAPVARIAQGEIRFDGRNLATLPPREYQRLRGRRIAMIFQDAMSALNPVKTVGHQLMEVLKVHLGLNHRQAYAQAVRLLQRVHIPDAARRMEEYPHRLSGGMSQRVMIAMAIACEPALLIADEPTTALDVTIQAQILDLLREIQRETGMALLLITHDLGVVAAMAQRVAVMYAGRIVEQAPVLDLFDMPQHPYTRGLLKATPTAGQSDRPLYAIPGRVPTLDELPSGCAFANRCPQAQPECGQAPPLLTPRGAFHQAACYVTDLEYLAAQRRRAGER